MSSEEETVFIDSSKSVIVVADTHLGVKDKVSSRPLILSGFLQWVKRLEEEPISVKLGDWGEGEDTKALKPPQELILLGDILELWDATDRSVDACSRSIIKSLGETLSRKIYVLGNHDHDLSELVWEDRPGRLKPAKAIDRNYPLGRSQLLFFDGVYPPQRNAGEKSGRPRIRSLGVGDEKYLFVHGHQFDKLFTLPAWRWMPQLRAAALAFGSYTWVFVILFLLDLILSISSGALDLQGLLLLVLLACVSIPFLIIQFGRKIWNRIRTRKYDRKGGLEGFVRWWRRLSRDKARPEPQLNVVYGHTHLTDFVKSPDDLMNIIDEPTSFQGCLLNLPAWSKDLSEEREEVLQAVFLYIDQEGSWFFAWDWGKHHPFLIPKQLIKLRREGMQVVKGRDSKTGLVTGLIEESRLEAIGWPEPLIDEWRKPSRI